MATSGWRVEGGVRHLDVDFRDGDAAERLQAMRTAIEACEAANGRIPILVRWEADGLDLGFLKAAKDANRMLRHLDIKAAFLGLGGKGGAFAAIFNARVGHERVRSFDDEGVALAWLEEEGGHGSR